MIDAIRTNVKIKNQRRRTVNAIGTYDRIEEMMERTAKQIKRKLKLTKNHTTKQRNNSSSNNNTNNYHSQYHATNTSQNNNIMDSFRSSDSSLTIDHQNSSTTSSFEVANNGTGSEVNDYSTEICTPASSTIDVTTASSNNNESKNRRTNDGTDNYSAIDDEIVAVVVENDGHNHRNGINDRNVPVGMDIPMMVPKRSPSVESALTDLCSAYKNNVANADFNDFTENQSVTSGNDDDSNSSGDNLQHVEVNFHDMTITEPPDDADGTISSKFLREFGEFVSSDFHPNRLTTSHVSPESRNKYHTISQQNHHHSIHHPPIVTVTQTPSENIMSIGFTPVKSIIVKDKLRNEKYESRVANENEFYNSGDSDAQSMLEHEYREICLQSNDFQPLSPISEFTGGGFNSSTSSLSMMQYNPEDDDFDALVRDSSYWEICPGEHDSPKIQRKEIPVIITEESSIGEYKMNRFANRDHQHPLVSLPGTDSYTMNEPSNFLSPLGFDSNYPQVQYPNHKTSNLYPNRQLSQVLTPVDNVVPTGYPLPLAPPIDGMSTSMLNDPFPNIHNIIKHSIGIPSNTIINQQSHYGNNTNHPRYNQPSPTLYNPSNIDVSTSSVNLSPTNVYSPSFKAPSERLYDTMIAEHEQYCPQYSMDDLSYDYNTIYDAPLQGWEQSGFRMEPPPNSTTLLNKIMM
jgi:hypothetical protein